MNTEEKKGITNLFGGKEHPVVVMFVCHQLTNRKGFFLITYFFLIRRSRWHARKVAVRLSGQGCVSGSFVRYVPLQDRCCTKSLNQQQNPKPTPTGRQAGGWLSVSRFHLRWKAIDKASSFSSCVTHLQGQRLLVTSTNIKRLICLVQN